MQKIHFKIIILSLFAFIITSCGRNPLKVDVSKIDAEVNIKRFEQDFYNLKEHLNSENDFHNALESLKEKYGQFYNDWVEAPGMMGIGRVDDPQTEDVLREIVKSQTLEKLMNIINAHFEDFSAQEKSLQDAFKHFKYYFPDRNIPEIVTFFSNFSMTLNPVGQNYIGVSLDMHLGDTFFMYNTLQPPIEFYFHKLFVPENISALTMIAHANDLFYNTNKAETFSDEMLYWGKLLYFTEAMMPDLPKHFIIGYTKDEYNLCVKEEKNIWDYIVKQDLLYTTEKRDYMRFFTEGPFTSAPGVPAETPAMIGRFAGWQAVKTYMKKFPETTLEELMMMDDSRLFISKVKYKP